MARFLYSMYKFLTELFTYLFSLTILTQLNQFLFFECENIGEFRSISAWKVSCSPENKKNYVGCVQ